MTSRSDEKVSREAMDRPMNDKSRGICASNLERAVAPASLLHAVEGGGEDTATRYSSRVALTVTQESAVKNHIPVSPIEASNERGAERSIQDTETAPPPSTGSVQRQVSYEVSREDHKEETDLQDDCTDEDYDDDDLSFDSDYDSHDETYASFASEEEEDQQRDTGVIAIGIPAPPAVEEEKEEEPPVIPPRTPEEAQQEAVSEAVARDIAETEHDTKHKAGDTSMHEMVPRSLIDDSFVSSDGEEVKRRTSLGSVGHGSEEVKRRTSLGDSGGHDSRRASHSSSEPHLDKMVESNMYGTKNKEGLLEDDDDDDDEEGDLEAQAGIPVVMPGAYAMEGMEAEPGRQVSGYDSGFDNSDSEPEIESPAPEPEEPPVELEAELHQETPRGMLVEGFALDEEEEALFAQQERKVTAKVRALRFCLAFTALAAVGVIIGVSLSATRDKSTGSGTQSSGWHPLGQVLTGTTDRDGAHFGSAVTLSGDGSRLLVSMPGWDESPSRLDVGQVTVYDYDGEVWNQVGKKMNGPGPRTSQLFALSQTAALSNDKTRVAFGSPDVGEGQVAILQEPSTTSGSWSLVGQNLTAPVGENGRFGYSVALSSDGSIVAVGSPLADNVVGGTDSSGVVRVYRQTSDSSWQQMGQDIFGENQSDFSGWSVAMSSDGMVVAIGSPGTRDFTGTSRVFRFDGVSWNQSGDTLWGNPLVVNDEDSAGRFGHSVSLSQDGSMLAVGAWEDSANDRGSVRVFKYMANEGYWEPWGNGLMGTDPNDNFGYSVSLSASGNELAVGGPRNTDFLKETGNQIGSIRVFDYNQDQWNQRKGAIRGSVDFQNLGHSVSLSSDGSRVAGGAPFASFDGKFDKVGQAGVFEPV